MHKAGGEAIERARAGGGPSFIEAVTYRYEGHWIKDDHTKYRRREEVEEFRARDPLTTFRKRVLTEKSLTETHLDGIDTEIEELMDDMVRFSEESANPEAADLYDHVFTESTTGKCS